MKRIRNGYYCQALPSTMILATREKQLDDKEGIETLLDEASNVMGKIDDEKIKEQMQKAFDDLFVRYRG